MLGTTKELATRIHVHPQTIRRMVARGEIPSQYVATIGGEYRYNMDAIEAYLLKKPAAQVVTTPRAADKGQLIHLRE